MIGKTLAHYQISALLGKGGMGEVYRATDTKLGREVALKILPHELSGDPERAARFQREARSLAMLQHPNVASIYGFEESEGVRFLVMELVEGEDLSDYLKRGKPSVEEARRIARQMAAGLEAAHEKGIVHRDLKPANVMFNPEGEIKILDFGLARAWFGDGADSGDLETSPTITAAMTQAGTILGTAAYMSPEQARGRNVDRRADIWAYGVILWEVLTGEQLFEGETVSDTLAAVLRAEPEWEKLPVDKAPDLCRLVERCLVRDPRQRLRDIGEARLRLEDSTASGSRLSMPSVEEAPSDRVATDQGSRLPALLLTALVALAVGVGVGWLGFHGGASEPAPPLHLMVPPPPGVEFNLGGAAPGPVRVSPDGRMITFTAQDDEGVTRLYLRHLDREESLVVPGTEDAAYPFWSPDSQFIGFFTPNTSGKLRKVAVAGGPPITLCNATNGKGGSWNERGTIIFAPAHNTPILGVPEIGGEPDTLTTLGDGENSHRHPRFLPDGDHFLYLVRRSDSSKEHLIRLASLKEGDIRDLTESESQAEYSEGNLLTAREGNLLATPFDLKTLQFQGGSFPLVEEIMVCTSGAAAGVYSFSKNGMMVYQTGVVEDEHGLQWVDLESGDTQSLSTSGAFGYPRISPDGKRCTIEVRGESTEGSDLWLVDLSTGLRTRFTFDDRDEIFAVWTPDGASIIYSEQGDAGSRILRRPVDTTGSTQELFASKDGLLHPTSVSPDGSRLYLDEINAKTDVNLMSLDLRAEPGTASLDTVLATATAEGGARISPDGRWLAYHTESAARWDVFVRPVSGGPRKWQVSTTGSVWPQWSADGSELYTNGFSGMVTSYPISRSGEGIVVGSPKALFTVPDPSENGVEFTVDPNGSRILSTTDSNAGQDTISYIHVVTDWRQALGR